MCAHKLKGNVLAWEEWDGEKKRKSRTLRSLLPPVTWQLLLRLPGVINLFLPAILIKHQQQVDFFLTSYLLKSIWWGSVVPLPLLRTPVVLISGELRQGPSSSPENCSFFSFFVSMQISSHSIWCTTLPFVLFCAHKYTPTCHFAPPLTSSSRLPLGIWSCTDHSWSY